MWRLLICQGLLIWGGGKYYSDGVREKPVDDSFQDELLIYFS